MTFEQIPTSLKNPLIYFEVGDPVGAGVAQRTTVLMAQRITGKGTGTDNVPVQVFSADDVAGIAGSGSMLHRLAYHYFGSDVQPEDLIVVPIADPAGAAATKTLTFSFSTGLTLTESGTITFLVAGHKVTVAVSAGQSLANIGDAVEAAFGTDEAAAAAIGSMVPVTCANSAGACTFTARNLGALGNDIRIVVNYNGNAAGERLPGNLAIDDDDVYLAGGSGVPDITAALLALQPYAIFGLVCPLYSADELLEKKIEFERRWGYSVASYGGHFGGVTKLTMAELVGTGMIEDSLKNDWHGCIPAAARVPWDGVSLAGACAGRCIQSLRLDPTLPAQTLDMPTLYPVRRSDRMTGAELESLTAAGFATITYDTVGTPIISLERTTMLTNALGAPVTGGEAVQIPYAVQYIVDVIRTYGKTAYARVKLIDDTSVVAEGVPAVCPREIKADIGSLADQFEEDGIIESAAQFKAAMIVERDTMNRTRVNIDLGPDLANQLRVIAVRVVPKV